MKLEEAVRTMIAPLTQDIPEARADKVFELNLALSRAMIALCEQFPGTPLNVDGPHLDLDWEAWVLRYRYNTSVGTVIAYVDLSIMRNPPEGHEPQPLRVITILNGEKPPRGDAIVEALEGIALSINNNKNREIT